MTIPQAMRFQVTPLEALEGMLQNDRIVFEPKIDGTRALAVITQDKVTFHYDIPVLPFMDELAEVLLPLLDGDPGEIVLDGVVTAEGEYLLFDMPYCRFGSLLTSGAWITQHTRFERRHEALRSAEIVGELRYTRVRAVAQIRGWQAKRAMFEVAQQAGTSQIIAKDLDAPYQSESSPETRE